MSDLEDRIRAIAREEARAAIREAAPTTDLISVDEYARRRSISPSTVRKALRENRLPFTRIGRIVRIRPDAEIGRRAAKDVVANGLRKLGLVRP